MNTEIKLILIRL